MKNEKVTKGRTIGLAGPCLNAVKATTRLSEIVMLTLLVLLAQNFLFESNPDDRSTNQKQTS